MDPATAQVLSLPLVTEWLKRVRWASLCNLSRPPESTGDRADPSFPTLAPFVCLGTSFPPGPPLESVTLKAPTRMAWRCTGCCALTQAGVNPKGIAEGRPSLAQLLHMPTYLPIRLQTTVLQDRYPETNILMQKPIIIYK